jgi:hypothetical protein
MHMAAMCGATHPSFHAARWNVQSAMGAVASRVKRWPEGDVASVCLF